MPHIVFGGSSSDQFKFSSVGKYLLALFVTSLDFPFLHVIPPLRQHWVVCRLLLTVSCVTVDWRPFTWGWSGTLRTPWLLPSFWRLIRGWSASSTQVICCKHFKITHTTDLSKHACHYLQSQSLQGNSCWFSFKLIWRSLQNPSCTVCCTLSF